MLKTFTVDMVDMTRSDWGGKKNGLGSKKNEAVGFLMVKKREE